MLATVARSVGVSDAAPSPKYSTNLPTTLVLRSSSVTVSTRSVAVTPSLQLAGHVHADHVGRRGSNRLAQHAGFGFDAAHAPAQHADAVDHRGVRVGADGRVGIVDAVLFPHAARQVLEVDLVADAVAGRDDADAGERLLGPFQEGVALAVALELDLHVLAQRVRRVVHVDVDRVIDDEIDRHQRLDAWSGRTSGACASARIAAKSFSAGKPAMSCSRMRASTNGISSVRCAFGFQPASALHVRLR